MGPMARLSMGALTIKSHSFIYVTMLRKWSRKMQSAVLIEISHSASLVSNRRKYKNLGGLPQAFVLVGLI